MIYLQISNLLSVRISAFSCDDILVQEMGKDGEKTLEKEADKDQPANSHKDIGM